MTNEATIRCEHLACLCEIPAAQQTCSPYCGSLDGKDAQNILCECGHPHCQEQIDKQLHGEAGSEG